MNKFLFLAVLLFVACSPVAKFRVVDVDGLRMAGLTGMHTEVVVENSSRRDLTVLNAEATIRVEGREVGRAALAGEVFVPGREASKVELRFRLSGVSIGALGALNLERADDIAVDIDAEVKLGSARKKIRLRQVPLSRIITIFEE